LLVPIKSLLLVINLDFFNYACIMLASYREKNIGIDVGFTLIKYGELNIIPIKKGHVLPFSGYICYIVLYWQMIKLSMRVHLCTCSLQLCTHFYIIQ
jgi:hypothetical protein